MGSGNHRNTVGMVPREQIASCLEAVRARMQAATERGGRSVDEVRLVAVTKTVGLEEVQALHALGVTDIGENRIETVLPKIEAMGDAMRWHMIGPVQRRKARDVVRLFDRVDAVDRPAAAEALQRRCEDQDRRLAVLVEVNVSGEEQKHGFVPGDLDGALREMQALDRLRVDGLMTMAPFGAPEDVLRPIFRRLRELAEVHGLATVSMGMTDDFEIAIEEGATEVRIGRALFE